jgi:ubiquinone/menaquinone biosynthesis C-methylase UbiE
VVWSYLDLGCGTGTLLAEVKRACPSVRAAGVDADPAVLARAARRLGADSGLIAARAVALPFPGASFDLAVSTLMLHHLPTESKRAALGEVCRVLRPGGRFLLVDFATPRRYSGLWWRVLERVEHVKDNRYGLIPRFLAEAGLVDVRRVHRRWPAVEFWAGKREP